MIERDLSYVPGVVNEPSVPDNGRYLQYAVINAVKRHQHKSLRTGSDLDSSN